MNIQTIRRGISRLSQLGIDSDLNLADYHLLFSNARFKQISSDYVFLRNLADTAWQSLELQHLYIQENVYFMATGSSLNSYNVDDAYAILQARRSTIGLREVARMAGGVEEAFELLKGKLTGELKGNGKVISNALIADEVTSAPAAGATQAGRIIRVRSGAGVATSVQMCCLNSANAYEWVTLGTAS